jgi:hypothetical protein
MRARVQGLAELGQKPTSRWDGRGIDDTALQQNGIAACKYQRKYKPKTSCGAIAAVVPQPGWADGFGLIANVCIAHKQSGRARGTRSKTRDNKRRSCKSLLISRTRRGKSLSARDGQQRSAHGPSRKVHGVCSVNTFCCLQIVADSCLRGPGGRGGNTRCRAALTTRDCVKARLCVRPAP